MKKADELKREYFKRGREWEIREYKQHLFHDPQIPGVCSWCRMEIGAGRRLPEPGREAYITAIALIESAGGKVSKKVKKQYGYEG